MGLEDCIRNSLESSLKTFILSEEYQQRTDRIERLTAHLKDSLTPDQNETLMALMDEISECDGKFASEAYVRGIAEGIAFGNAVLER